MKSVGVCNGEYGVLGGYLEVVYLKFFAFLIIAYFFQIVSYYTVATIGTWKLAEKINYDKKWVSFIPFLRIMVFNRIMNDKVDGFLRGRLNFWLMIFPILLFVSSVFFYLTTYNYQADVGTLSFYIETDTKILLMIITVGWLIIYGYVIVKFIKRYSSNYIYWFLVMGFLLLFKMFVMAGLVVYIALWVLSENIEDDLNKEEVFDEM